MTRRLAFLLAAGLLCAAAPLQAQIVAWQGAATKFASPILLPSGSAAAPGAAFADDPDTGISRPTTNQLTISAGTNEVARFLNLILSLGASARLTWGVGFGSTDLGLGRSGTNGALKIDGGTTPTGTGCGTGASYSGNNSNGAVTIGTTPGTCVVTFNGTWTNAPHCTLNNERAAGAGGHRATGITATQFTITGTLAATDVISWSCWGP